MRFIGLMLALMIVLTGCGGGGPEVPTAESDSILATRTAIAFTPIPTRRPTATPLANPDDPLTIVLGGEYRRGGYWTWDDISNLLGVYETYDAYTTVTLDGQDYTGVPLDYLLDWAQVNPSARGTVIFTRNAGSFSFTTLELRDCEACLIARTANDTLALVLPGRNPNLIDELVRIDSR